MTLGKDSKSSSHKTDQGWCRGERVMDHAAARQERRWIDEHVAVLRAIQRETQRIQEALEDREDQETLNDENYCNDSAW